MPGGLPEENGTGPCSTSKTGNYVPIIRDPAQGQQRIRSGVLFPRLAGSERLFLLAGGTRHAGRCCGHVGVQTVLPPGDICCCGISAARRRRIRQGGKDHHRQPGCCFTGLPIRSNYLDIKTVVVSCGHLFRSNSRGYEFDSIFPGSKIMDIHEYLLEKGGNGLGKCHRARRYMYHEPPVISPMKKYNPLAGREYTDEQASGTGTIALNERLFAASRATLAVTRPDVFDPKCVFRKEQEVRGRRGGDPKGGGPSGVKVKISDVLPVLPAGPGNASTTIRKWTPITSWWKSPRICWDPDWLPGVRQCRCEHRPALKRVLVLKACKLQLKSCDVGGDRRRGRGGSTAGDPCSRKARATR